MSQILYSVTERVATITLNRPELLNAFADGMREALLEKLCEAEADTAVGCVVITGAGAAFCAGGDIASMRELQLADDVSPVRARMLVGGRIVETLRAMTKPVIAAVNGAAAGAGMNLALACDLRYGSTATKFAESFVRIGLVPDWAGHYLLTRLVGTGRALELMLLGDRISAPDALRLGILNEVFEPDEFAAAVGARASRLAAGPAATMAAIKRGVYLAAEAGLTESLAYEQRTQEVLFLSADAREGMQAFLDKRIPRFGG